MACLVLCVVCAMAAYYVGHGWTESLSFQGVCGGAAALRGGRGVQWRWPWRESRVSREGARRPRRGGESGEIRKRKRKRDLPLDLQTRIGILIKLYRIGVPCARARATRHGFIFCNDPRFTASTRGSAKLTEIETMEIEMANARRRRDSSLRQRQSVETALPNVDVGSWETCAEMLVKC
jgi:hypothetical protein